MVTASTFPLLIRIDARLEPREVNGQPGAILRDRNASVVGTVTLDVLGGRIQTIRSVANPDKPGHLGPVVDAWALAREAKQASVAQRLTGARFWRNAVRRCWGGSVAAPAPG